MEAKRKIEPKKRRQARALEKKKKYERIIKKCLFIQNGDIWTAGRAVVSITLQNYYELQQQQLQPQHKTEEKKIQNHCTLRGFTTKTTLKNN